MPRPRKRRRVESPPKVCYFKPRGVPLRSIEEERLTVEEIEALRLADVEGLSHEEAGKRMNVSRATFGRILKEARRSVAKALASGMAIRIEGGDYIRSVSGGAFVYCRNCKSESRVPDRKGRGRTCPDCGESLL